MAFNPTFQDLPTQGSFNSYLNKPYVDPMDNNMTPQPLPGSQNPYLGPNMPLEQDSGPTYKRGGRVKAKSRPSLRDLLKNAESKGRYGDSILAHINPQEARMLQQAGGSGTINPETGQPEFNPISRALKRLAKLPKTIAKIITNPTTARRALGDLVAVVGTAAGAATGNPYLAAAAGAARTGIRQDKGARGFSDYLMGGAKHAGYAALGNYGMNALGGSAYVAPEMSWTTPFKTSGPAGMSAGAPMGAGSSGGVGARASMSAGKGLGMSAGDQVANQASSYGGNLTTEQLKDLVERRNLELSLSPKSASWMDKVTDPATLVALGSLGLNAYSGLKKGPKEDSPEEKADKEKRLARARRLTPAEMEEREANRVQEQALIKKYKPKSELEQLVAPILRKQSSPEEYEQSGKWFSYYKDGGKVKPKFESTEIDIVSPNYLDGYTMGQDDKIPAKLSDGEYVMDAATVSDLGDGNNKAGAHILDVLRANVRKHKRGGRVTMPPKAKSIIDYIR